MKFILDENGICLPDTAIPVHIGACLLTGDDIHISNALALDVMRAKLISIPKEKRPEVEWIIYGKKVEFNDYMRSLTAWNDPRMNIGDDAATTILTLAIKGSKRQRLKE
jgi:hypothetical protein